MCNYHTFAIDFSLYLFNTIFKNNYLLDFSLFTIPRFIVFMKLLELKVLFLILFIHC